MPRGHERGPTPLDGSCSNLLATGTLPQNDPGAKRVLLSSGALIPATRERQAGLQLDPTWQPLCTSVAGQ